MLKLFHLYIQIKQRQYESRKIEEKQVKKNLIFRVNNYE